MTSWCSIKTYEVNRYKIYIPNIIQQKIIFFRTQERVISYSLLTLNTNNFQLYLFKLQLKLLFIKIIIQLCLFKLELEFVYIVKYKLMLRVTSFKCI